ncbi:MAG: hypothetical protein LBG87_04750 [Spirochaetaceae bacterium]|jgi:transglutaminase-like putative cysteine protease|nr:hypothetical protein [Spirochaetaceae bacterium]
MTRRSFAVSAPEPYLTPQPPGSGALLFRSAALALIFCQLRLLVKDLADTPVFAAALATAFITAWRLFRARTGPFRAAVIFAMIPWLARLFIALPRLFFPGPAAVLDALLLGFDRNNFVALIPFYWTGFSTYLCARSRTFLQADIIIADTLLVTMFSIAPAGSIGLYRLPVLMILVFVSILFFQILALILSAPAEYKVRKSERISAAGALFAPVLLGGFLFLGPFQEKAVDRGGGLLTPNLFSFDFSQFLHLESEISMNDDLVFIVRKDPGDPAVLLRRYVLSGYTSKQGFFRYEPFDETAHPQKLPERKTALSGKKIGENREKNGKIIEQEYYLVNFDASAFIGINEPVTVTPFEHWDASSFNAAYAVQSLVSEALSYELYNAVSAEPSPQDLGLSPEEYAFYTDYGKNERIAGLARQITAGYPHYQDKVTLIYRYLKEGDYRYSFKPGIAPDGDQLSHFLFQSKKGYCSYYAFSMSLLLRSLGIPARVAAGFTIENTEHALNYYPVRSNAAHAWVEVRYPGYGWIEYDPTTQLPAEGEMFEFSSGMPKEFEKLLREILDNHGLLVPKEGTGKEELNGGYASAGTRVLKFIREYGVCFAAVFLTLCFILIRTRGLLALRLTQDPRKKANRLWKHAKQRLALGGYKKTALEAESEWAKAVNPGIPGVYPLYQAAAAARYAPEYTLKEFAELEQRYRGFSKAYAEHVPVPRRLLAWLLPPLALTLGPSRFSFFNGSQFLKNIAQFLKKEKKSAGLLLIVCFAFSGSPTEAQYAEESGLGEDAHELYYKALESQKAEHWERAIELYAGGLDRYPEDPRFPWALGELYYKRRLYGLAWDYYRKAERLLPDDTDVLYQLSRTAAHLNRDEASAAYLEQLLRLEPDNQKAIGNLGWMYFKLHRLGEGRALLLSALERLGPNPDFSMTLGTIYSYLFQYPEAKQRYLEAIAQGEEVGDRRFTAVSHYNLSILETRFYQYDRAFDRTNASLQSLDRATGRLARGELFLKQLEFKQAFSDYQIAYELESASVPLSKVNLAQSYQRAGYLDQARLYAEDCLNGADHSWMLNYGIDPVRYKQDLHEILYQVYAGLEQTEYAALHDSWRETAHGMFRKTSYWFKKKIHRYLFRKYSLLSANKYKMDSSAGGDSNLDALLQYYRAFEEYPRRALRYLRRAEAFEVPLIPESAATYRYEEGRLLKKPDLLYEVLPRFHPVWQRDMTADCFTDIAKIKKRGPEAVYAAESLYLLNRGALRQNGIALPLECVITAPVPNAGKMLLPVLKAAGIDPLPEGNASNRFALEIRIQGQKNNYAAVCELRDKTRQGAILFRYRAALSSLSNKKEINAFIRNLTGRLFSSD